MARLTGAQYFEVNLATRLKLRSSVAVMPRPRRRFGAGSCPLRIIASTAAMPPTVAHHCGLRRQ
jgi:hypothetical protein